METIGEVEEEYAHDDQYPDQIDEHSTSTPTDDLLKMAESLQDVLCGGGCSGSSSPLVKRARKLLYRRLRVGVEDGRILVGKFHCLDKQGNLILYDTLEYRQIAQPPSGSDSSSSESSDSTANANAPSVEQRSLGLVLIPARCRTSCFVECSINEQLSLLSVND